MVHWSNASVTVTQGENLELTCRATMEESMKVLRVFLLDGKTASHKYVLRVL